MSQTTEVERVRDLVRELREVVRQCHEVNCAPFKSKVTMTVNDRTYYVEVFNSEDVLITYYLQPMSVYAPDEPRAVHMKLSVSDPNDVLYLIVNGLAEPLIKALRERMALLEEIRKALG